MRKLVNRKKEFGKNGFRFSLSRQEADRKRRLRRGKQNDNEAARRLEYSQKDKKEVLKMLNGHGVFL